MRISLFLQSFSHNLFYQMFYGARQRIKCRNFEIRMPQFYLATKVVEAILNFPLFYRLDNYITFLLLLPKSHWRCWCRSCRCCRFSTSCACGLFLADRFLFELSFIINSKKGKKRKKGKRPNWCKNPNRISLLNKSLFVHSLIHFLFSLSLSESNSLIIFGLHALSLQIAMLSRWNRSSTISLLLAHSPYIRYLLHNVAIHVLFTKLIIPLTPSPFLSDR